MPFLYQFAPRLVAGCVPWIIRALRLPVLLLVLLGAALALGGCSALRLSYNNAPELLHWWLDGFADFDKAQSQRARADLAELARWHRREELPLAADLLQSAQALASQSPSGAEICALYERSVVRMEAVVEHALPAAAAVALTLQAGQLRAMEATFDKNNRKWREEWLSTDGDSMARRTQKIRERLEDFYGALTPSQVRQLQASMEKSGADEPLYYREILRRQRAILETLAALRQTDASTAQTALAALAKGYFHSPDAAYRAYKDRAVEQTCEAVAEVQRSATAQQRKNMVKALQGYSRDVQALMAQTP